MKFIHLSDLHIGKKLALSEVSLIEDQQYILTRIINIIDDEKPDAVLISGDIYDKSIPSAEAVVLFDDFLCRLAKRKLHVFIISGNHDSAERLSFGGRLLENADIHISPVYDGCVRPVTLCDRYGKVNFWMLPFIKPIHVKRFYPDEEIESYTDACRVAVEKMGVDQSERNVILAHQFVTGAETCESEEINVGGTDNVSASVFDAFDYVALGHIHGPQNVGSNRIRYCGTPLKYSFSEEKHLKSVTVVELGEKGSLELHTVPLVPKHDLRKIKGTFEQLTDKTFYSGVSTDDYIHIDLTNEEDVPEAYGRLRVIYPNIISLGYDNTRTNKTEIIGSAENVQNKTPFELFEEFYQKQNSQPLGSEQTAFLKKLIENIWEENK